MILLFAIVIAFMVGLFDLDGRIYYLFLVYSERWKNRFSVCHFCGVRSRKGRPWYEKSRVSGIIVCDECLQKEKEINK